MIDDRWLAEQVAMTDVVSDTAADKFRALISRWAIGFAGKRADVDSATVLWPRRGLGGDESAAMLRAIKAGFAVVDDAGYVTLPTVRSKTPPGRYALLCKSGAGVGVNLEYIIQIGATAELVIDHGWPPDAIDFERGEFDALGHDGRRFVLAMEAKARSTGPDSLESLVSFWLRALADSSLDLNTNAGRKLRELARLCEAGPIHVWLVADSARWSLAASLHDGRVQLKETMPPIHPRLFTSGEISMNESFPYDANFHRQGSVASEGKCSQHGRDSEARGTCAGDPIISFKDRHGRRQSGCELALEQLVARGEIAPPRRV